MTLILLIDCVIVLSLVLASRRRLENALPLFCFFLVLLPFEARFVIPGLFDLTTDRIGLLTLLVLFVTRRKHTTDQPIPLKWLMLLYAGWALCSTAYSISVLTSIKQLIAQVLEYFLLYCIFVKSITDVRTVYRVVYAMLVAMGLCCVFGLFEAYATWSILTVLPSDLWVTYYGRSDPLYVEWGRGLRIRSTFPHPILFGDALAMSIPGAVFAERVEGTLAARCSLGDPCPHVLGCI